MTRDQPLFVAEPNNVKLELLVCNVPGPPKTALPVESDTSVMEAVKVLHDAMKALTNADTHTHLRSNKNCRCQRSHS